MAILSHTELQELATAFAGPVEIDYAALAAALDVAKVDRFVATFPAGAVGASKVMLDLFTVAFPLVVERVVLIKDGSVAHTGVLAAKYYVQRTLTPGTSGTAGVLEGSDVAVPAISRLGVATVPGGVTTRLAPTAGVISAVIGEGQVFTEETNAAYNEVDLIKNPYTLIPAGSGLQVIQGSVAATGNVGFNIIFRRA